MSGHDTAWLKDATASDDSSGELVAAAADAFDLLSAVKHIHSKFNKIAKRPHQTDRYAWLSTAAWVTTTAVCEGTCVGVDHCRQSWVDSPVVNCHAAVPSHVLQRHIAADKPVAIRHCS